MSDLSNHDPRAKYKAIERCLTKDIDNLSDEELLKEASEQGLNPAAIASDMRTSAMDLIATAKRNLLVKTREKMEQEKLSISKKELPRPSLDIIKRRLQELFSQKPDLAVAFRQGKSLSDSDWDSLWDDLVEIGAIKDDGSVG